MTGMDKMKIGIYGGSFSPPHLGHMKLARAFLDFAELDRLYVVPAGVPPHKVLNSGADGNARLEMCRAAFLPLSDKISVSDFEVYRTDPCYTVDTLSHFAPEGELYMLCGSDMFLTLDKWRVPERIFELAAVVCGARVDDPKTEFALENAAEKYRRIYGARCSIMEFDPIEISSTAVREELKCGGCPSGITAEVFGLIAELGLYGFDGGHVNG